MKSLKKLIAPVALSTALAFGAGDIEAQKKKEMKTSELGVIAGMNYSGNKGFELGISVNAKSKKERDSPFFGFSYIVTRHAEKSNFHTFESEIENSPNIRINEVSETQKASYENRIEFQIHDKWGYLIGMTSPLLLPAPEYVTKTKVRYKVRYKNGLVKKAGGVPEEVKFQKYKTFYAGIIGSKEKFFGVPFRPEAYLGVSTGKGGKGFTGGIRIKLIFEGTDIWPSEGFKIY